MKPAYLILGLLAFTCVSCKQKLRDTKYPFVIDHADVLSDAEEAALSSQFQQYQDEIGLEIYIVSEKSVEDGDLAAYSNDHAPASQIGTPGLNQGGIIYLSLDDRKMKIDISKGLEWQVPDTVSADILSQIQPAFADAQFAYGFKKAGERMYEAANRVPWEVAYPSLAEAFEDSAAVGKILKQEGLVIEGEMPRYNPNHQFNLDYYLPLQGPDSAEIRVYFTLYQYDMVEQFLQGTSSYTLYGRVAYQNPLMLQLLGLEPEANSPEVQPFEG
ncbi:TPM domain-containing protein [Pontibacter sp. G13]|uniref:TPM domain-containing protein n=1 Tax=Pontibacter sp. G13 TaxID=3074898 RepID=UPI00288C30E4|nr:TPM domain-containing protein [Pontibacter sp. G13]WNJ17179.1 TPM domain-containing protein [Pontibacter sp. G13]